MSRATKWKLKSILWKALNKLDCIQKVFEALSHFPRKQFQLRYLKICKKLKNVVFNASEHSFSTARWPKNHFAKSFIWANIDLKMFLTFFLAFPENGFNFVTQKFPKNWKISFSKVQNIRFLFSKILFDIKVGFTQF